VPDSLPVIQFPAPGLIHDLRWAPEGNQLAIAVGTEIHLYDAELAENRVIQLGIWTERLAFDRSNTLFGAALKDGSIRIWDWGSASQDEVCKFTAHSKGANSLSFQPDGNLLATTGTDIISRIWDISLTADGCNVKAAGQLIGSSFTAPDVSFSADGQKFALVDIKDIYLRESQTRKLIAVLHGDQAIFDIAFSPDGRWLAAAQNNNSVTLWDLSASPKPTSTLLQLPLGSAKSYTWRVDFSPHDTLLAAATSDGEMLVWQLPDLQPVFSRSLGHPITGLAFNPATSALTVGTLDGSVYRYAIK
jgi:WD40 repeat protein